MVHAAGDRTRGPAQLEVSGAGITLKVGDRAMVLDLAAQPARVPARGVGADETGRLLAVAGWQSGPARAGAAGAGAGCGRLSRCRARRARGGADAAGGRAAPRPLLRPRRPRREGRRGAAGGGRAPPGPFRGAAAPGRADADRGPATGRAVRAPRPGSDFAGVERGPVEGLALLAREAALAGDRASFDRALAGFPEGASTPGRRLDLNAMWSFDRGEWQAQELDGQGATEFLPVAAVLPVLGGVGAGRDGVRGGARRRDARRQPGGL